MMSGSKNEQGFTLVEILVSIAVAAIVVASLNQITTTYVHLSQRGRYVSLANEFVESKVEELRNDGFASIALGTSSLTSQLPAGLPVNSAASMTVSAPQSGLKQIDLQVKYNDQGATQTYNYTTLIGELGVVQ